MKHKIRYRTLFEGGNWLELIIATSDNGCYVSLKV